MSNILIIKLGALGDVVRTTSLLRVLKGNITWITSRKSAPLLANNPFIQRLICIEDLQDDFHGESFDLVINLEDEIPPARLASSINAGNVVGACLKDGKVAYSDSAREWFDMSLISRFGRKRADELKMENRKPYQEFMFSMVGSRFQGEEYVLNPSNVIAPAPRLIGIEARAGDVWPIKRWTGYEELAADLQKAGFQVKNFTQCDRLSDYIDQIQACEIVVCGDTLAMHIALALKRKVVAIFNCTTPHEIYGYQRMVKVVSPLWEKYFYRRDFVPEAASAIPVQTVFDAVRSLSGNGDN